MSNGREFVGERGGRLGWYELRRGSFDYARERLFALERRAQDDSRNRQRQEQATAPHPQLARSVLDQLPRPLPRTRSATAVPPTTARAMPAAQLAETPTTPAERLPLSRSQSRRAQRSPLPQPLPPARRACSLRTAQTFLRSSSSRRIAVIRQQITTPFQCHNFFPNIIGC
jgi:hypothetical protein